MSFRLVDIFSGPGGLGEGFASYKDGAAFKIGVSAEMEASAHKTLVLRSFFRLARSRGDSSTLESYYAYCRDQASPHPADASAKAWEVAADEARCLTLGNSGSDAILSHILTSKKLVGEGVVVVGGPPCQAYSLVGRARNRGVDGYVAAQDHRHYLYREYLRILHQAKPAAFVMENVKGLLSSRVDGRLIVNDILRDLLDPSRAIGKANGVRYTLHSLVVPARFARGMNAEDVDANDFVVRAEEFGIPQRRHRLIIFGVREELNYDGMNLLRPVQSVRTVRHAIEEMPPLRSRLKHEDSSAEWTLTIQALGARLVADAAKREDVESWQFLVEALQSLGSKLDGGALRLPVSRYSQGSNPFLTDIKDPRLEVWLNHESRSHMTSDLARYFFAAAFADRHLRTPKGHRDFALDGLAPNHKNWLSGKFVDRFRVQQYDKPSTTITSHIAKDGHYFIHPDFSQCRSLTVREAARLQTFPDNYFFQGNRTQQFHQVGNAVPPMLARQIAAIVEKTICSPT
jgi:DNA (cytosine-5)-methyltransferase 1